MKVEEISYGHHEFGAFQVSIQPCCARPAQEADFFEVITLEKRDGMLFYVDLQERFGWFTLFERKLTEVDLVEYNHRVSTVFHSIAMPTWKLSRHSIPRLEKLCRDASKKKKAGQ